MNSKTKQAINRIQELQFSFAQKLSIRIKEIRAATGNIDITASHNTENNATILTNTHDLAHKLAGSAGTFQFTEVSNQAKKLENLCAQLLDDNRFYPKDWASQIQKLLIAIEQASHHKAQTLSLPETSPSFNKPIILENEIVLVDDDELVSALIQQQAKHFGYNICCITNPEDLSIILQKAQPKIILMDIVFPKHSFNGIDLIKQLKADNKIHCPVIFMSNEDGFLARLDAVRAGSDGYIVKPVNILELIEILDRHIHSKKHNNFRALIIDDDPIVTDYYQHILQSHQFDCESISHPLKVIEKLLRFHPDIILLDINMPECDSFEMAEVIRQDNRFTHIPILFLTTDNENERKIEALKVGGDYVLNKNTNKETFITNVISHSQRSKELHYVIERLRKDEIRFQAVSHSSSDAIITLNKKGLIILWNQGAENIFGYQAIEVIGHSIEIIIPPESQEKHRKGFNKLVKNDSSLSKHSIESQAITKDQKLISIELTYTEWKSGNERFFTSIIRDISHRKQIENELKSQQENLNAI
ncbi:MAG: response regulator, partial [Methylococcales bacterium]